MKKILILALAAFCANGALGQANGAPLSLGCGGIDMVFVKGGTLSGASIQVGSFYIGKFEVTQKQWKDVMGDTLTFETLYKTSYSGTPSYGYGDNYPVYCVSWDDAQAFLRRLNLMTGGNFRLPTEAEWEYAARGGDPQQSSAWRYAGSDDVGKVAWYSGNAGTSRPTTDLRAANGIGAYNMSGNVYEWCEDWYQSTGIAATPPAQGSSSDRVVRGGSCYAGESYCRVSYRSTASPGNRYYYVGFRLACSSK
jgi:formylglycine-generating enzyme required for sulfatase activity